MTPLIQKAVRMIPDLETMWFDIGPLQVLANGQVPVDLVLNPPFPRTGIVGYDRKGQEYALWLLQDTDAVTVGGVSLSRHEYLEPFLYVKTDQGLNYFQRKNLVMTLVDEEEVCPGFRAVCAALIKLSERKSEAHMPIVQDTPINRKRVAKGKRPIFDWHTVTIGPWASKAEPQGGTHASPRLHDRRGHWRTIKPSGKRVWVRACKVGDASKGVVFKEYRLSETLQ